MDGQKVRDTDQLRGNKWTEGQTQGGTDIQKDVKINGRRETNTADIRSDRKTDIRTDREKDKRTDRVCR